MMVYLTDIFFEFRARSKLEGYRKGFVYIIQNVCSKVFYLNKYILFYKDIDELPPAITPINGLSVEILNSKHLELIEKNLGPLTRKRFQKRLKTGRMGHICQLNNKIIYHGWIEYEKNPMIQLKLNEASLFDVYTVNEFRNRGVQTAMLIKRLEAMRSKGIKRALCTIEVDNIPSQKVVVNKMGFKPLETIWYGKIFGKSFRFPKSY
jgi:hypothetical protein